MKFKSSTRKGFTLIELLVVVLILGILVAVALPSYLSSVQTSKTNTSNANAKTVLTAVQSYGVKNGSYPTSANVFASGTTGCLEDLGGTIPTNPCSSTTTPVAADWTVTIGTGSPASVTVQGVNSAGCTTAPAAYTAQL